MTDFLEESAPALEAFMKYCELGPRRSLTKLAQVLGRPPGYVKQLGEWSSKYRWVARARQYDEDLFTARQEKQQAAIDRMLEDQATIAREMLLLAHDHIIELRDKGKLGATATVTLLKSAADIWRTACGGATSRLELTGNASAPLQVHTTDLS